MSVVNLNAIWLMMVRGWPVALDYLAQSWRLYSGFGRSHHWERSFWRRDLQIPSKPIAEIFPEVDFSVSTELFYPMPRALGIATQELAVLCKVIRHMQPKRVVEFGTAEGRTAVNIANQLPPDGELITIDLFEIPGQNDVGYFYWNHPVRAKIKQLLGGVAAWDSRSCKASAEIVFLDACDLLPGLAAEVYQAFSVVKPGGVIFRHDYGSGRGVTGFWNWLAERLPIRHIEGTSLLCLRVDNEEYGKMLEILRDPVIQSSVEMMDCDSGRESPDQPEVLIQ
jgi:hypothetical protein